MKRYAIAAAASGALVCAAPALAQEVAVPMHQVSGEGVGERIGTVTAKTSVYGLLLEPDVQGLEPGLHGFHVHENPDCGPGKGEDGSIKAAMAAGGHYDPMKSGAHEGPYGRGHLGDLPALYVDEDGRASLPVVAPRLGIADIRGRSIIVHEGGDNYADRPEKLGGGGERVACGVVPSE